MVMVHRLQVGGADRPGPPGWAEPVQVRVELGGSPSRAAPCRARPRWGRRRTRWRRAGRNGSGTVAISPLARPCSMTWQNW